MKKTMLIVSTVIYSFSAVAQFDNLFKENYLDKERTVYGGFNADYNSTFLQAKFATEYLSYKELDSTLRMNVINNMDESNNFFGGDADYGLMYIQKADTASTGFYVGLKTRSHYDIKATKDLFGHILFGNKPWAGDTAYLGPLNLNTIKYQQLQLGILKKSGNLNYGVGISFIKGQENTLLNISKANLFTEEDGTYIDLDLEMEAYLTDENNTGLAAMNGFGLSTDLFFNWSCDCGTDITFSLLDLGFIGWNTKSYQFDADSSYHFEGINVGNVFDLQDSLFTSPDRDSLTGKLLPDTTTNRYSTTLPSIFRFEYATEFIEDKLRLTLGLQHRIFANYSINYYLKGSYFFNEQVNSTLTLAGGGYGKFYYGLDLGLDIGNGIIVTAGTSNLGGLITPKSATGLSGFGSLRYRF